MFILVGEKNLKTDIEEVRKEKVKNFLESSSPVWKARRSGC